MNKLYLILLGLIVEIYSSSLNMTIAQESTRTQFNYQSQSKPRKPVRRSNDSSTRGCQDEELVGSLSLLVPETEISATARSKPTVFFHIDSIPSLPLKVTLVEPKVPQPILKKDLTITTPGIHAITLPDDIQLEKNKTFIWNLIMPCAENPSSYSYVRVGMKTRELSPETQEKLASASDTQEYVAILVQEGLWYDALAYAMSLKNSQITDDLIRNMGLNHILMKY